MKLLSKKSKRVRLTTDARSYYRANVLHAVGWSKLRTYLSSDCSCSDCTAIRTSLHRWLEIKARGIGMCVTGQVHVQLDEQGTST